MLKQRVINRYYQDSLKPKLPTQMPIMLTFQLLQATSIATSLVAAICLYFGSLSVPHGKESWKGETEYEQAWRRKQTIMKWVGIFSALVAAACQTVVLMWTSA